MVAIEPYYESEALRRAASANSTPRKLRALRRLVDEEIGPDTSTELYAFEDGWTVRLLETITDKRRDGWLGKWCLRGAQLRRGYWLSLRDAEGFPHLAFHVWALLDADPGIVDTLEYRLNVRTKLVAIAGASGRGNSWPKDEHLERLRDFASLLGSTIRA